MHIYSFLEAKQNFSSILSQAQKDGRVQICNQDGQTFLITPVARKASPLDIEGVELNFSAEEIVDWVREGRERN